MKQSRFGLYIHWPFCRSKCPYCDFNSHAARTIDQIEWRAALLREMDHYAVLTGARRLDTVFFGGGTPSLMDPATCAALLDRAAQHWNFAPDVEITLEANPSTAEMQRFADFRAAGVNRLSLGVQSLDDSCLAFLGRGHNAAQAIAAIDLARQLFPRFSFDLIYARPGQTESQWEQELSQALTMAGDHLSLYQLTIEEGTAFAPRYERGDFSLPDDSLAAGLYGLTEALTADAGLPAYEISNYARPGGESRHNLLYWHGDDYVGIGPGAHGRVGCLATSQIRSPETWLAQVKSAGHGTEFQDHLTAHQRAEEMVMMGLRLVHGIKADTFLQNSSLDLWSVADMQQAQILQQEDLLTLSETCVQATYKGRLVLNSLIQKLLK